ncbi:hypothetical protein TYRP_022653 [Tyrophagus putrescentiae]|nr:hypothetical protein TYRP_022653 [Tyrophagus putrescentiae]
MFFSELYRTTLRPSSRKQLKTTNQFPSTVLVASAVDQAQFALLLLIKGNHQSTQLGKGNVQEKLLHHVGLHHRPEGHYLHVGRKVKATFREFLFLPAPPNSCSFPCSLISSSKSQNAFGSALDDEERLIEVSWRRRAKKVDGTSKEGIASEGQAKKWSPSNASVR